MIMLKRAATDGAVTRKFEKNLTCGGLFCPPAPAHRGLACVQKNYTERVLKIACEILADETKRNTELRLQLK
ncbi:hypothetical protein M2418_003574 [Rhizobium sp. BIGb0125]|nr:hypothetical protein [Rhizobium sp. BIGb0125]